MARLFVLFLVLTNLVGPAFAAKSNGIIEPAVPKWGDEIRLIYHLDPSDATLGSADQLTALVTIWFPGHVAESRLRMSRKDNQFEAEMAVPQSAAFVVCYFVTTDAWAGPAYAMVYTPEGRPARGAWMESMVQPWLQKDYADRAAKELALYPDNWEVYADKWSCAMLDLGAQRHMIQTELPLIERNAVGRPLEALYSLTRGYLWLGDETAAHAVLQEMVTRFPDKFLTAQALDSYEFENFVHHFTGGDPADVREWWKAFCRRNPHSYSARSSLTGIGGTLIPLETTETICRLWIKDEPDNPTPYGRLAEAYEFEHVHLADGLVLSEKALRLLVAGQLRLHGDIFGKITDLWLPALYVTAAKLACDQGQYEKGLAYAKASEALGSTNGPKAFEVEAQIWEALGRAPKAKAALTEAWKRGSEDAQKRLAARYPDVVGSTSANITGSTGEDAPAFQGTTLDGAKVDSASLRGKVIVANFWFTACGPCKAEIPDLNRLTKTFQGKDVVFLAFDTDENIATLQQFLKQYPFDYTIVLHASEIAAKFGINTFPSHVIIGRDGKIEATLIGGGPNVRDLATIVARLVSKP